MNCVLCLDYVAWLGQRSHTRNVDNDNQRRAYTVTLASADDFLPRYQVFEGRARRREAHKSIRKWQGRKIALFWDRFIVVTSSSYMVVVIIVTVNVYEAFSFLLLNLYPQRKHVVYHKFRFFLLSALHMRTCVHLFRPLGYCHWRHRFILDVWVGQYTDAYIFIAHAD